MPKVSNQYLRDLLLLNHHIISTSWSSSKSDISGSESNLRWKKKEIIAKKEKNADTAETSNLYTVPKYV